MIHGTSVQGSPTARAARAAHLHRRMQLEHAYLERARQELRSGHPATAATRAAYFLAKGAAAIARHDATAPLTAPASGAHLSLVENGSAA